MQPKLLSTLALAAVLVLAGPVGPVLAGSAADAGPAAQARTSAQDANNTTVPGDAYPPGLSPDGVENASALAAAHRRALVETGYRFRSFAGTTSTVGAGVAQSIRRAGSVEAGLARFAVDSVVRSRVGNRTTEATSEAWANGTTVFLRSSRAGETSVRAFDRGELANLTPGRTGGVGGLPVTGLDFEGVVTESRLVELVLRSGRYEVTGVRRAGGRTLFTLSGVGVDETAVPDARNVTGFDATVVVDGDGRVHRLNYTLVVTDPGGEFRTHYEYVLVRVGPVEVERPPWTAEAEPATPTNRTRDG